MSLSIALSNALSGLQLNQRILDVTAQNIANVNTEGYSRKIVHQQAVVLSGQGSGVEISSISRNVSESLLRDIRTQMGLSGNNVTLDDFYSRMQDLFGSPGSDSSIGAEIEELAARFQAFAANPEDQTVELELVNRARFLTQQFNNIADSLQGMRLDADQQIGDAVTEINGHLTNIQTLNLKIAENLALGRPVTELQDQRDVAMSKVAEYMDFNYFYRSNGEVVMFTPNGRPLIDRTVNQLSHTSAGAMSPTISWAAGSIDGITLSGNDITSEIGSGKLAALIQMRDSTAPDLYSQFDELARALHDEINAIHNQGTSFPGAQVLTGTRNMAGGDTPPWSGTFRVGVTDATTGAVVEFLDIDLATQADVTTLVATINGMANVSATINANGNVVLTASAGNRISTNEMDSAVTVGSKTMGASDFLGLNDFFTSGPDYQDYSSAQQSSSTAALGLAGTLTFDGVFGTTNVNYLAGNSLTDIATAINGNGTLTGAGISASVIQDGTGYRLRVTDAGGDNFFVSDSGTLASTISLFARGDGLPAEIGIRSDILAGTAHVAHAQLSNAAGLAVSDIGVTSGDNTIAQAIANRFNADLSFDATGALAASSQTLSGYGVSILSLNATQANNNAGTLSWRQDLLDQLNSKMGSLAGVNLDDELANMILIENAYSASARVMTTTNDMFETLQNIVR